MNPTTDDERARLWPNSVVIFGLLTAHLIIKHKLVSLNVGPVRTDPCDGVNVFAFVSIACVVFGWLRRSSRPPPLALRFLYALRSQQAALLAILIALLAEIIAMARQPAAWIGIIPAIWLLVLVGALAVATVATQLLMVISQRNRISLRSMRWTRTTLPVVCALVALAVCPEWPTYSSSRAAHILTVAVGAFVVLVPLRLLLPALVLNGPDAHGEKRAFRTIEWGFLTTGIAVALYGFFAGDLPGGVHIPIFVFEIAECFIAYAVLRSPLGIGGRANHAM
jgi:hypothetical protein